MADQAVQSKRGIDADLTPRARGGMIESLLTFFGESALLSMQSFREVVRGGISIYDLLAQMAAIGADSIWIVLTNTSATGAVFAFYVTQLSNQVGYTAFVGGSIGYGFLNELGPVLAGVAVASRSGAAIAAEIGSMVVTEQVDALRAMAVSPIRYLVAPRVVAAVIMMPLLTVIADFAGLVGGYFFATMKGVPPAGFWNSVHQFVSADDLMRGLAKSVIFGFIVGLVACQQGLRTSGGATGVGRATTSSVVLCVVLIFIADFFLTQILTPFGR